MPFNGSGTFLRVMDWEADRDSGIKIRADRHDAEDDNFASGLSNTLTKDGQTQPVANIPMNGKKLINLGTPTVGTDAATKTYVDSLKKFTSDIEVTDEVIFKDGTVTRGYIKGTIGAGVSASMIFETDNDAGAIVNRMTLDANGLNLRSGGFRLTPSDVLRGSIYGETSSTPAVYIRGYDTAGVEKSLLGVTHTGAYFKTSDTAVTAYSLQFRQSDNVQRGGLSVDFAAADGSLQSSIKNAAGTTRNFTTLDINGLTLSVGKFVAPAWEFPSGFTTSGNVNVDPSPGYVQFLGTSPNIAQPLVVVRDNRATTTTEGNPVFSIKRQNSTTDALILGNDANNAGLIGGNNTPLRFGKWVNGVFTEYMNISTGAYITATANLVVDSPNGAGGINILPSDGSSGRLFWNSNTHTWATVVDESDGTLRFCSGGTFATSTGTARFRLYETGDFLAGGKGQMTELIVDPTSAVTGIHIKPSDANSGRLFFETATTPIKWSISAWDADGTLRFNSGGTYGSATGTARMQFYENGTGDFGNLLRARYAFQITRDGIDAPARGTIGVSPAFNLYMQRYGADGSTVEGSLVLAGGAVLEYSPQAGATTARFDLNDNPGTARASLYWDATNGAVIYARDAANARIGYVTLKPDGRLLHGTPTAEYEVIDTGNLHLTIYTGSTQDQTTFPIGHTVIARGGTAPVRNGTTTVRLGTTAQEYRYDGSGTALAGTWRARGYFDDAEGGIGGVLFQRTA